MTFDQILFDKYVGAVNFFKEYVKCYFDNRDYIHEKLEVAYDATENRRYKWLLERVDTRMNLAQKAEADTKIKKQVTTIDLNIDLATLDKMNVPFITSEQQMIDAFAEYERKLLAHNRKKKEEEEQGTVAPGEIEYLENN